MRVGEKEEKITRRTLTRLRGCNVDVELGCNLEQMNPRDLVLSMFQKIDSMFDLVVVQSEKPLVMIRWVSVWMRHHA